MGQKLDAALTSPVAGAEAPEHGGGVRAQGMGSGRLSHRRGRAAVLVTDRAAVNGRAGVESPVVPDLTGGAVVLTRVISRLVVGVAGSRRSLDSGTVCRDVGRLL